MEYCPERQAEVVGLGCVLSFCLQRWRADPLPLQRRKASHFPVHSVNAFVRLVLLLCSFMLTPSSSPALTIHSIVRYSSILLKRSSVKNAFTRQWGPSILGAFFFLASSSLY